MGRGYVPNQLAVLASKHAVHCELIEIVTKTITLRYAFCDWNLTYVGTDWEGKSVLSVRYPEEDMTLAAHALMLHLAGNNSAIVALALSTPLANSQLRIFHAVFDPSTYQVIPNPILDCSLRVSHVDLINLANQD